MNRPAALALCLALAPPATAGDLIGGTNTYMAETRTWKTGEIAGYYIYDSTGTTIWETGPLENGPVECHGAGFWDATEVTGEGICIFGAPPHQWTVAHRMPPGSNRWEHRKKDDYHRTGLWTVVHGTGRYVGLTGTGTFISKELVDGRKTTWFQGEVEFPE